MKFQLPDLRASTVAALPFTLNVEALHGRRFRDCFGPCQVAVQYMFVSVARARPRALPARRECRSKAARVRHLMVDSWECERHAAQQR